MSDDNPPDRSRIKTLVRLMPPAIILAGAIAAVVSVPDDRWGQGNALFAKLIAILSGNKSTQLLEQQFARGEATNLCFNALATPEQVMRACTAAIQIERMTDIDRSLALSLRAHELLSSGNSDSAIEDYNKAIDINPANKHLWVGRGNAFRAKRDFARALENYNRAIELDAKYSGAFSSRGHMYMQQDLDKRAIQEFDRAIQFDASNADAFLGRGVAHQKLGELAEALTDYDSSIRINPSAESFAIRCATRLRVGRASEAITDCLSSLQFKPGDPDTEFSLASAYLRANRPVDAVSQFDEILANAPNNAAALYLRGVARWRNGDRRGATIDIDSAKYLQPDIAQNYPEYPVK